MVWHIEIFRTSQGRSPVAEFMDGLPAALRAKLVRDIDLLEQFGLDLGGPYIKKIQGISEDIWELRTRRSSDLIRTLFSVIGERRILLLHSFVKKTQRIPRREIRTAEQRLKLFRERTQ